jgi:hypothetical protein
MSRRIDSSSQTLQRKIVRYGPLAVALIYSSGAVWSTHALRRQHLALFEQKEAAALHARSSGEQASDTLESLPEENASAKDLEARLHRLTTKLAEERSSAESAEARVAKLEAQTSTNDSEVTASFGRVEEIATATGGFIRYLCASAGKPNAQNDPEAAKRFEQGFADLMKNAGALKEFENQPEEIAKFQAALLREFFGSDAIQGPLNETLQHEFAALKSRGYCASQKPEETGAAETAWYKGRDEAVDSMASRISPLIAASPDKLALLPGLLNIGGGLRIQVNTNADGHGSVRAGLAGFKMPGK